VYRNRNFTLQKSTVFYLDLASQIFYPHRPQFNAGDNSIVCFLYCVDGLFGAGDAVGGTPHAFSSGSFTEGRLSAKAACKYIDDGKADHI
jgi:hypothetical protein